MIIGMFVMIMSAADVSIVVLMIMIGIVIMSAVMVMIVFLMMNVVMPTSNLGARGEQIEQPHHAKTKTSN